MNSNRPSYFETLIDNGCVVEMKNNGHHWIIKKGKTRFDFWPAKEKFRENFGKVRIGFEIIKNKIREARSVL